MSFTSGKISQDPFPGIYADGVRCYLNNGMGPRRNERPTYSPRPEYDNHNPILVWLRAIWADPECGTHAQIIDYMLNDVRMIGSEFTREQRAHARRVLAKLALS